MMDLPILENTIHFIDIILFIFFIGCLIFTLFISKKVKKQDKRLNNISEILKNKNKNIIS